MLWKLLFMSTNISAYKKILHTIHIFHGELVSSKNVLKTVKARQKLNMAAQTTCNKQTGALQCRCSQVHAAARSCAQHCVELRIGAGPRISPQECADSRLPFSARPCATSQNIARTFWDEKTRKNVKSTQFLLILRNYSQFSALKPTRLHAWVRA